MGNPKTGDLLIAEPFMRDPNFIRTVVLLCEHHKEGSFGLVINKPVPALLSDVLRETVYSNNFDIPLYYGGPCEQNTLHYIHSMHDLPTAVEVSKGLFWGGDFEELKERIKTGRTANEYLRFFVGYSGWNANQLNEELKRSDWILDKVRHLEHLFEDEPEKLWKLIMENKGGEFKIMSKFPINPQLN